MITICPGPSEEQKEIITGLASSHVIVDAVAGSGKTTTSLHIANTYPTKKLLLITYNARLKLETRARVELYNILNLEIHSYHSFGYHYYNITCMNDSGIAQTIEEGFLPTNKYYYDIIILDELQDMSFLYYKFVHKIINDMRLTPRLCLLGDIYQNIYSFNNADSRFLSMADHIFASNAWLKLALSMSFRLTDPMGIFVNTHVFKTDRIKTNKPGERIRYIICDSFKQTPYYELIFYLKRFKPEEIFVLAPSVRKGPRCSPIRVLANKMSKRGIPVYVPNSDEDKLDDEILKGKLCFSTFHQVKGLERRVVIVYSFDDSYYIYYNREANRDTCPNELYVAITRCTECLSLIHHYQNDYLPFLDIKKLKETVWLQLFYRVKVLHKRQAKSNMGVGDMTKHLPPEITQKIYDCLKFKRICAREKYINIPFKVKQRDGLMENVSDITGVAIPAYYEWLKRGKLTINKETMGLKNISVTKLLKLANHYCCISSGYYYKLAQITNYNWLDEKALEECIRRLEKVIVGETEFEKMVYKELNGKYLSGFIDCVDDESVWEFKCVKNLLPEHFIQLALYAYLYGYSMGKKGKLMNILTGEVYELIYEESNIDEMLKMLIDERDSKKLSDQEFLEECKKVTEKMFDSIK